eukprot:2903106-Prymnesium_polylepis.1
MRSRPGRCCTVCDVAKSKTRVRGALIEGVHSVAGLWVSDGALGACREAARLGGVHHGWADFGLRADGPDGEPGPRDRAGAGTKMKGSRVRSTAVVVFFRSESRVRRREAASRECEYIPVQRGCGVTGQEQPVSFNRDQCTAGWPAFVKAANHH